MKTDSVVRLTNEPDVYTNDIDNALSIMKKQKTAYIQSYDAYNRKLVTIYWKRS